MILFELRDYLRERETVSLGQLCDHFQSGEDAMERMLEVWSRKGKLATVESSSLCGGCSEKSCSRERFFRWQT